MSDIEGDFAGSVVLREDAAGNTFSDASIKDSCVYGFGGAQAIVVLKTKNH
ncbi:MAG: hypothetical protein OEV35_06790 [Gallionellaceae bacterium]|nr:hypothetical protein [Gallionellaceae bacterium]